MKYAALLLLILLFAADAFSQKNGWDKLQTEDGEFTMLMPAGCYSNFYDRSGITVYDSDNRKNYRLPEMRVISCYRNGAMLNVEIYETLQAKSAAKVLREKMSINGENLNLGKNFYGIGKTVETKNYFLEQQLVAGGGKIYLITAAAREKSNAAMRDFLDSVRFAADDAAVKPARGSVLISSLENSIPQVVLEKDAKDADGKSFAAPAPQEDETMKSVIPVMIPTPSYTEAARKYETNGKLSLRLTFGAEGTITHLQVVSGLPHGLVREAVIAALRIKFLPQERDGNPVPVTKVVEYNFGIY